MPHALIQQLTVTEQDRVNQRWEIARTDPLDFLRYFVTTCDQHDQEHPIKPFPWERRHVQFIVRLWEHNPKLVIAKSRQMLMTWLFTALALWDAMFHSGRLIMLQSKREEDAIGDPVTGDGLLGRAKFILEHLPAPRLMGRVKMIYNRIEFLDNNSTLWAIPQGAAIIRQRTASGVLSDECGFQDEFSDAYVAAQPCIRGGGWFVALSTANPGFFQHLFLDDIGEYA